jgi:hypothetical protein
MGHVTDRGGSGYTLTGSTGEEATARLSTCRAAHLRRAMTQLEARGVS